ncbi:unnamed protein product [Peronospora belbahrii]|uniref:Uncharacterized protein n=1 Tax=Peronospora belbahrii TaxID=622444 RepID=A0AAU9KR77_9STRA|nr:unnamed protein product [Peronospora belbahrii]
MMKISALAVVAAIAIANVSGADQPALRSATMPVETAPGTSMTTPDGDKKEHFWGGGPWGGLGWGGGWGNGAVVAALVGVGGWGWGWEFEDSEDEHTSQLALTSTSTPEFQDDEDLRTCRRCRNCYRQRLWCRPTCFALSGYASGNST